MKRSHTRAMAAWIIGLAVVTSAWSQETVKVGQTVTTQRDADLYSGDDVIATVPVGTRFRIEAADDTWLRGTFEIGDQSLNGWIDRTVISLPAAVAPTGSPGATGTAPAKPEIIINVGHPGDFDGTISHDRNARFLATYDDFSYNYQMILWDVRRGHRLRTIPMPKGGCEPPVLSPDGRYVLVSKGPSSKLFDVAKGRVVKQFEAHQFNYDEDCEQLFQRVFSPDGRYLCLHAEKSLLLCDLHTKVERHVDMPDSPDIVEFSPDGTRLLAYHHKNTFLIDTTSGQILSQLEGLELAAASRAFAGDSSSFVLRSNGLARKRSRSGRFKHEVAVFDRDGKQISRAHHKMSLRELLLSYDGSCLALTGCCTDEPERCELWDARTQEQIGLLVGEQHKGMFGPLPAPEPTCIAFRDDGKELAVGVTRHYQVNLFTGHVPDDRYFVHLFSVPEGKLVKKFDTRDKLGTRSLAYVDGGQALLRTRGHSPLGEASGGAAQVWSVTGKLLSEVRWNDAVNDPVAATGLKDNDLLFVGALGGNDDDDEKHWGLASVWDMKRGILDAVIPGDMRFSVSDSGADTNELHVSPDGTTAFVPSHERGAWNSDTDRAYHGRLIDLVSGHEIARLEDFQDHCAAASFSPDGKLLAVADFLSNAEENERSLEYGTYHVTRVYDTQAGRQITPLFGNVTGDSTTTYDVVGIAFSPSGKKLLTVTDFSLRLWNTTTWKEVASSDDDVHPNRWDPNCGGLGAVFADEDSAWLYGEWGYKRWDFATDQVRLFPRAWKNARSVSIDPRRKLAAYAGDHGIGIVDLETGKSRAFREMEGVRSVVLPSHEGLLVTVDGDGWVRVRDQQTLEEICRMVTLSRFRISEDTSLRTTADWLVVTPEGLFDGSYNARQKVLFRIGDGLNVVPVDRFFQDFYYPGLLAAIWRGERPKPDVVLGEELPPLLVIDSPQAGGDVEQNRLTLTVTAKDQGGGIKGPSLKHNGARLIGAVHSTERIEGGIRRTFAVELIQGENVLEVVSASADGSFESEPARLTLRYSKPLPKSRLHVLVVGIENYAEPSLAMSFPVHDADRIAQVFAQRGGALYEDVQVVSLQNEAATSAGILGAIASLAEQARPQDTVVVFLAGHGSLVDQTFYFLPQDFRRGDDSLEDAIRRKGLPAANLGDALAQVPALKRMIVFDTGQSGGALPVQKSSRNPFAFRGAVERLSRAQGAFTIASSSVAEQAREVEELGHGILAYSLLAGLKAVDDGPLVEQWVQPSGSDKVAHAMELFSFASSHTRELGRRYFGQSPDVQYSSSGMTFPVLPIVSDGKPHASEVVKVDPPPGTRETKQSVEPQAEGAQGNTLYVVAAGINDYEQSSLNLRYAAPDAQAIAALLEERSRVVFADVQVTVLLNHAATRQHILDAVEAVAAKAKPEDTLAVFLAGHGTMVGQRYFFLPHEFKAGAGQIADDIRDQGLAADRLGDAVSQVPARQRLLIFDTCASGGAIRLNRQGNDPFAFRGAIEQLGKSGGTFTLAAVGSNAEAQEVDDLGHGLLTYALLAAAHAAETGPLIERPLRPAAARGVADVLEWFSYAAGQVPRLSKQYFGSEQQVQLGGQGKAFQVLRVSASASNTRLESKADAPSK